MTEIFNDVTNAQLSRDYAARQATLQEYRDSLHLSPYGHDSAGQAATSTQVLTVTPTQPLTDTLMGTKVQIRWSCIEAPPGYADQRPFSRYVVPSCGGPEQQEIQLKAVAAVAAQPNASQDIQQEAGVLSTCLQSLHISNGLVDEAYENMLRFLGA